jgi:rod shape-determining protein MreC
VRSYLHLRETNESLHEQIVDLQKQLRSSSIPLTDTLAVREDTLLRQKYRYTAARVVNLRTNTRNNLITLNRGTTHGITTEMGVVHGRNVVGLVKDVSAHYAIVLPVINTRFGMSVRHKNSGQVGNLKWDGTNPRRAQVVEVARHVQAEPGDTLITTAYSNYFPENMIVATVESVDRSDANFLTLTVQLAADFGALERVEVVENLLSRERRQLELENVEP